MEVIELIDSVKTVEVRGLRKIECQLKDEMMNKGMLGASMVPKNAVIKKKIHNDINCSQTI